MSLDLCLCFSEIVEGTGRRADGQQQDCDAVHILGPASGSYYEEI